jgi:hypothetical protein
MAHRGDEPMAIAPPEDGAHRTMSIPERENTSPWSVAAAWIAVTIPLAWGVYQTVAKSMPLFRAAESAAAPARPAAR